MLFLTLALLACRSFKSEWDTLLLFLALSRVSHFSLFCFINSSRLDYKYWPAGICWQLLKSLPTFGFLTFSFQRLQNYSCPFTPQAADKVFQQPLTLILSFLCLFPNVQIKYRGYANAMINHKTQGLDRNIGNSIARRFWTWRDPVINFAGYSFGDRICFILTGVGEWKETRP